MIIFIIWMSIYIFFKIMIKIIILIQYEDNLYAEVKYLKVIFYSFEQKLKYFWK